MFKNAGKKTVKPFKEGEVKSLLHLHHFSEIIIYSLKMGYLNKYMMIDAKVRIRILYQSKT